MAIMRQCRVCGKEFNADLRRSVRAPVCSRLCYIANRTIPVEARFWAKVNKNGPVPAHRPELGPCWVWTACRRHKEYGSFSVAPGRNVIAHRYSLELALGRPLGSTWALHACDNPPCVNPAHLFEGTVIDNVADMVAKGRGPIGDRSGSRTKPDRRPRGEGHECAVLSENDVLEMRRLWSEGVGYKKLATQFGVGATTVRHVVSRATWAHVV